MVYYAQCGCGGMADTGDLKSPAHKACGFESRQPHKKRRMIIRRFFVRDETSGGCNNASGLYRFGTAPVKTEFNNVQCANFRIDPSGFPVLQLDLIPAVGGNIQNFIFG